MLVLSAYGYSGQCLVVWYLALLQGTVGLTHSSLQAESPKSTVAGTAGATSEESKNKLGARPSPSRARGAPASQPLAAGPGTRPSLLATRQRLGGSGRDGCGTSTGMGSPQPKQSSTASKTRLCWRKFRQSMRWIYSQLNRACESTDGRDKS